MIKNSIGNITEILTALDKEKWTGEELQENYAYLVEKWGEWEIVGEGAAGIIVRYVNIGNALFSGLAITFAMATFISFVIAVVFGKIIFPLLRNHYKNSNDELVDVATLQSAAQIDKMTKSKHLEKGEKKEWF